MIPVHENLHREEKNETNMFSTSGTLSLTESVLPMPSGPAETLFKQSIVSNGSILEYSNQGNLSQPVDNPSTTLEDATFPNATNASDNVQESIASMFLGLTLTDWRLQIYSQQRIHLQAQRGAHLVVEKEVVEVEAQKPS